MLKGIHTRNPQKGTDFDEWDMATPLKLQVSFQKPSLYVR